MLYNFAIKPYGDFVLPLLLLLLLSVCRGCCCWLCGYGSLLLYTYNFICICNVLIITKLCLFSKILSGLWATICLLTLCHIHFALPLCHHFPPHSLFFFWFSLSFFWLVFAVICYQFYWNSTSLLSVAGLGILLCFAFHVGKINTSHTTDTDTKTHAQIQTHTQIHKQTHRHGMAFSAILCDGFLTL